MCAIEVSPVVTTERLVLRGAVRRDAEHLCDLAADFNVAGMTVSLPHPYGLAEAEAQVADAMACDWDRRAEFVIDHRSFGPVGMIGARVRDNGRPEIGFWVGRPFWNRGYATEALRGTLAWVKREWRRRAVTAGHFADNPASGQVLCKAGFLYTGDVELRRSAARGEAVATRMMVWLA